LRAPFEFCNTAVKAGSRHSVEIKVARLPTGAWTAMPAVILHGRHEGPVIWLSAAIHGDELNGVEIIRQLLRILVPKSLAGTIIAIPIVNVYGVTTGERNLPDRRDLNRSFPGSPRGSLAARLAHIFFEQVALRCAVGIDYHTGSNGRTNLPQIRCDMDDPETAGLARAFHPPLALHASLRDGSLRAAASRHGMKVLLYEGGEVQRFQRKVVQEGVDGTLRVLKFLQMIPAAPAPVETDMLESRSSMWIRAGCSGFARVQVGLGKLIEKGQAIATVADSLGGPESVVHAREGGMVIGRLNKAVVHRGDALVHVARVAPQ
jgi:hypothetical protein